MSPRLAADVSGELPFGLGQLPATAPAPDAEDCSCATLPSAGSAADVVAGVPGGIPRMLGHMVLRGALVGTGLAVAGFRGKDLVKGALAGSAAIEVFVLGYLYATKDQWKK